MAHQTQVEFVTEVLQSTLTQLFPQLTEEQTVTLVECLGDLAAAHGEEMASKALDREFQRGDYNY